MKGFSIILILISAMLLSACGGGGDSDSNGDPDGDTGETAHCSERTEYTGSIEGDGVTFQRNDCNNLIYYRAGTTSSFPVKTARHAGFLCETYSRQRFARGSFESIIDKTNTHCFEDNGVYIQRRVTQLGSMSHITIYEKFYDDRDMENYTHSKEYRVYSLYSASKDFLEYSKEWDWGEVARKAGEALFGNGNLVGSWSFIYPAEQCTETYIFNSNNTFKWRSLDEVVTGTYYFSPQANSSNRHPLSLEVTSDNQQFDCKGNNHNDVGLVVDIFAEFPSETVMNWYYESTGGSLIVTLDKN